MGGSRCAGGRWSRVTLHDRKSAAQRVGRHLSTIYKWEDRGWLRFVLGHVREADLLAADKLARQRRGRPRNVRQTGPESVFENQGK